ncbi:acyl-CoA thioester hydrolase/BAAT C-terminal domain-containing protein [Streptomyces sp. JAC25]|uniref:acyl-CoA thioester hydrolase/BAAT C-terminal domain-containing protein n=1 Tax=Streptomyces sp. JAC25 TaxID=3418413 RepID=UPI003D816706
MDNSWQAAEQADGPVAIRGWYELSERTYARRLDAAAIPVEKASADILLVAGGDAMWPSVRYAEQLAARRRAADALVHLVTRGDAGHRPRFPGEGPAAPSKTFAYGGTARSDALLGEAAWAPILGLLHPGQAKDNSR